MKIVFSNYDDLKNPYYAGGGARAVHEVAKRLAKDNEVTVFTGKYPGARDETIDGVVYVRTGTVLDGPKVGQLAYQLCLIPMVLRGGFDVWVESFTPPFSTSLLPLLTKKPVIGLVHMLAAQDMTRKYRLPIFNMLEKRGLKFYRYLITPSNWIREKISSVNPEAKVRVIPNGVDIVEKSQTKAPKKHILFLGRIEIDQKGLDLLLTAYSKVSSRIKYPLVIAGSGEKSELDKLNLLIKKLGIKDLVKLAGRVKGEKKERLFEAALFVVIPSRYETFSITALEAMARGVSLVVFDIEGFGWIPGATAVKVPGFDVSKLSQKMLELSKNRQRLSEMGKSGKKYAKRFGWEKISDQYAQFLSESVNPGSYE
jgi:phosphatidylinositol alpha-mannosyltransferase